MGTLLYVMLLPFISAFGCKRLFILLTMSYDVEVHRFDKILLLITATSET